MAQLNRRQTPNRDPQDYKHIVNRLAYKYARSILPRDPSLEIDDLIQDGWVWFTELTHQEQVKGGFKHPFESMLTTWLEGWYLVRYEALTTKKRTRPDHCVDAEISPSNFNWGKVDQYLSLSEEAREVVKIIWEAPKELLDLIPDNGKLTVSRLTQYLSKIRKWEPARIRKIEQIL